MDKLRATSTSHSAQLLVAATGMKASHDRHMRCCEIWKLVEQCFDDITSDCINFHALSQIFACLTRGSIAEREDAIYNLPWTQTEKDKALAICRRSQLAEVVRWMTLMNQLQDYVRIGPKCLRNSPRRVITWPHRFTESNHWMLPMFKFEKRSRTACSRFLQSFALPDKAVKLQLLWGNVGGNQP